MIEVIRTEPNHKFGLVHEPFTPLHLIEKKIHYKKIK